MAATEGSTVLSLFFVLFSIIIGALIDFLLHSLPKKVKSRMPPPTALLFLFGMAVASIKQSNGNFAEAVNLVESIDPDVILFILLPPLLFEYAMEIDFHIYMRVFWQSFTLAIPGVFLQLGMFACLCYVPFYNWSANEAILVGTILSTTDPIAVCSILKTLGAPKKLATIIEGESLMNDASAFVMNIVFTEIVAGRAKNAGDSVTLFFSLAIGGPLWGYVCGLIAHLWLWASVNHPAVEISILVLGSYTTFYSSESLGSSGVLSTVAYGLYMCSKGKYAISPESLLQAEAVLKQIGYFANTLMFFLAGTVAFYHLEIIFDDSTSVGKNWISLCVLFAFVFASRGLMVLISYPFMRNMGYGLNGKEAFLIVYGGMRGAVSLALALILIYDKDIRDADSFFSGQVTFLVSGVVCISLILNGSTVDLVYQKLNLYPPNPFRATIFHNVMRQLESETLPFEIQKLRNQDEFFARSNWKAVKQLIPNFTKSILLHGELVTVDPERKSVMAILNALGSGDGAAYSRVPDLPFQDLEKEKEKEKVELPGGEGDRNVEKDEGKKKKKTLLHRRAGFSSDGVEVRRAAIFESIFNAIMANYQHQFEDRTLSPEAIGLVMDASNVGLEKFSNLQKTEKEGKTQYQESDLLLDDLNPTNQKSKLLLPFQAEFDILANKIRVKPNRFIRCLSKAPCFGFLGKWYYFSHIGSHMESIIGFLRAHEEIGFHLLSSYNLDTDDEIIGKHIQTIIIKAKELLLRLETSNPRIFTVVVTVLTARVVCRILREKTNELGDMGYINKHEESAMLEEIHSRLRGLDEYLSSISLGRIASIPDHDE